MSTKEPRSKNKAEKKRLVIVRHAHRDKPMGHSGDNGISKKGTKQTKGVTRLYEERFGDVKPVIYSSPKLRCIETVEPLAEKKNAKLTISDLLDEAGPDESPEDFVKKVREFANQWKKHESEIVIACTHGDWIPTFFYEILGTSIDLKKGGWAELELEDGKPKLSWIVQEPEIV